MEFENSPEDAPAQGNNGSPLTPGEDSGLISLLSPPSKDSLRAFIQRGQASKEEATSLLRFCHSSEFSWFDDEASSNNDHNNKNNNAATRQMESSDSTHMSASSSNSSQNPPTQPQTPTFTHNSSIGLEYYLPENHLPDNDGVGLETFLRWLLGSQPRPLPQAKVRKLYDMSRLPGHGTDEGFKALIDAANSAPKGSGPVASTADPLMAEFGSLDTVSILAAEQKAAFGQNFLTHSCEQDQLSKLDQQSQGKSLSGQSHMTSSRPFLSHSHSNSNMSNASLPITVQRASVQQFVTPAALDLSQPRDGNHSLMPLVMASQRVDNGHGDSASSPSARGSSLESPHVMAPQSSIRQNGGSHFTGQAASESSEPPTSPTGDSSNKIKLVCPMSKDCEKSVESDNETNAYKYLIEHIRRVHPDNHIPHLPSTKESVDKMINVEVAVCTLMVNGAPCDFRLAGQKGSRSPWRQALNHIRDIHRDKYHPGLAANKNSFVSMMKGGPVVTCILPTKDDEPPCTKVCMGDKAYRSIIEHARRAHPDQYIKTPSSSKEGWLAILRHNGLSASAMERSVSDDSSSSAHNSTSPAVQRQSPPRQLPTASTALPAQTPALASANSQASSSSQVQGPAPISVERDQVISPNGPRQFVHPYMLQHEVDAMALFQQNGHADPMTFDGQSGFVQAAFPVEYSSQNLGHDAHGTQLSIDGALRPSFGDSIQPGPMDPTLARLLFPSLNDSIIEPQEFTQAHTLQHNVYQAHQSAHISAVQAQDYSRHGNGSSHRKRERDGTDGPNAAGQEPPSKRVSVQPQHAALGSAGRHSLNGLPASGGIGGAIPPLTEEWFGSSLEKLNGNHFSILVGATIRTMTTAIPQKLSNNLHEELVKRWSSADQLVDVPVADLIAKMKDVGLELEPAKAMRICDSLQTLAKEYVKMPPTKDRRFGCEHYPPGAVHNVIDGEAFEAEDKALANEVHALNASWEISHITKQHFVIDAWRIFGRDVLLGRAQDWNGTGAAPGFEPEWKRVKPLDSHLRTLLEWLWMREGVFWDPLTDVKHPLQEHTRLAANQGRLYFHTDGHLHFKASENPELYEVVDASGISPNMTRSVASDASMGCAGTISHSVNGDLGGFLNGSRSFNGLAQGPAPQNTDSQHTAPLMGTAPSLSSTPLLGGAEDSAFTDSFPIPIDGPDTQAGLSAFDGSMFDGGDGILNSNWNQYFE